MTPQHLAALEYARRGWHVFPCKPRTKEPVTANGHLDATTDAALINAWWEREPDANVAIAVAPSRLYVLDVDTGKKKDGTIKRGRETLAKIDHELSDTLTSLSPRGGLHAIYSRPDGVEAKRLIGILEKDSGLDLLGDGYIVAAPSIFYDPDTGITGEYKWGRVIDPAPLPPFLCGVVRTPRAAQEKVQLVGTPIGEGGRNHALFRLACALRDQGIGAEALARALDAENQQRCSPPLSDAELGLIINSALQRVTPTRDVALGAVVEAEVRAALAPASRTEWVEQVAARREPPMIFYSTGFEDLDKLLGGGFATRQQIGLIAPPSAGKSALVGHWLVELSQHRPVLHASTELPRHELFVRYAAHAMGFPWRDGIRGAVSHEAMADAVKGLRIKLLGCDDLDRMDPMGTIEQEAARMADECGIAPIIADDYLQMMARGAATEMRHKVGELSMRGRVLAQALDTVVITVLSTGRAMYNSKATEAMRAANDPTAYLSAAKESGDIEFDCATLLYLDVDKLHKGNPKPARLAVARCRVGDVGFVGLRAQLDVGKFWGDPSAVEELSSEDRMARKVQNDLDNACKRLLDVVQRMTGRPWKEIQTASKLNYQVAQAARAKLVEDGRLEQVDRGYDPVTRKKLKGDAYRVIEPPPQTAEAEKEDDDASA